MQLLGDEGFAECFLRSEQVAVDLSVMLKVAVGEDISIASGGSIEERELLN